MILPGPTLSPLGRPRFMTSTVGGGGPETLSGLYAWWKADTITSPGEGGDVLSWPDSSGNGRTITGETYSTGQYYGSGANGKPYIRFGSYRQFNMVSATFPGPQIEIYATIRRDWGSAANNVIFQVDSNYVRWIESMLVGAATADFPAGSIGVYGGASGNAPRVAGVHGLSGTSWQQIVLRLGPTGVGARVGNTQLTANPSQAGTIGNHAVSPYAIRVGHPGDGNPGYDLAELIIYSEFHSTTERDSIQSYLTTKYGV